MFWNRSSWGFSFSDLLRRSPRAPKLHEMYPWTFLSFLVLLFHVLDFLIVKKMFVCLFVCLFYGQAFMNTKRQQQFVFKSLSRSSCWLLPSLIETLWCFVVSDSGQYAAVGFFFFPAPSSVISAQRRLGTSEAPSSESSASCDWPTYIQYQPKAVFKRDSISAEIFSFELVADLHLVTSK